MKIIVGDLFDAPERFITHQCNCVTNRAAHLAASMFARFPYANIYAPRLAPDIPGTIIIRGDGKDQRFVIAMLGQYYPGSPKFPNSTKDGALVRRLYFQSCLDKILQLPDLDSIAFPFGIGCGAAGGDLESYQYMLGKFAEKTTARVVIYQLPSISNHD